jgi:hypothetical protein
MTWRSADWPIRSETNLTRLGEHRREYLEYEGQVSGDRGYVKRIAGGTCRVDWRSPHELEVELDGAVLLIQRLEEEHWLASPRD